MFANSMLPILLLIPTVVRMMNVVMRSPLTIMILYFFIKGAILMKTISRVIVLNMSEFPSVIIIHP